MKLHFIVPLIALAAIASQAQAIVVATTGFESPEYSLGNAEPQGGGETGWTSTWDNLYSTTATVSNADANGGTQSLQFSSTGGGQNDRVVVIRDYPPVDAGTTNAVSLKFDVNVSTLQNGLFIIYGLDSGSNQVGPEITLEHTGTNTHLDVLRRDGPTGGNTGNSDSGVDVSGSTWNTFELISNMETSTFSWSLNGIVQESDLGFRGTPGSLDRLRLWSTYAGGTTFVDNAEVSVDDITPLSPILEVERRPGEATGSVVLTNMTGEDVDILGYTIRSATSALSEADWTPITGNYDNTPVTGDGSVDSDDVWTILSTNTAPADLSESVFGISGPNTPGILVNGAEVDLGNIWVQTSNEDLVFELLLADGSIITPDVQFTGNGDEAFSLIDLNTDGTVDAADWIIFRDNHPTSGALASTAALSQRLGDLDGDSDSDGADFVMFKSTYIAENGQAAFAALISGTPVPEPSTGIMILTVALGGVCIRARKNRWIIPMMVMLFAGFSATPAEAVITEGWWRMGDSDASPVVGATISSTAGMGVQDEFFATDDNNELLTELLYSDVVPSPTIYDPNTDTFYQNQWSTSSTGAANNGNAELSGSVTGTDPRGAVTVESFVRFENISGGNGRFQFLYQRTNASGGWELSTLADGGIRLDIVEPSGGAGSQAFESAADVLQAGVWHHVAFVANPDSSGNDDVKVYVDGAEVISDNYTLADGMPDTQSKFTVGAVFSNDGTGPLPITFDETRFFKETRTPDQFLQFGALTAVVNTETGNLSLENNGFHAIELDRYQFQSPADRLLTDWDGMGDRDAVNGGNDPGETWEKSGQLGIDDISEVFLLGSTSIPAGQSIDLGTGYLAGAEDSGLSFTYHDVQLGKFVDGFIEFTTEVGGLTGDFNDDGIVNLADYTVWRDNLGGPESALNGNGNDTGGSMGVVDAADYVAWKSNFGATSGAGALAEVAVNVPEPSALLLALFGAVAVSFQRFRKAAIAGPGFRVSLAVLVVALAANQANAVVDLDRTFRMGDELDENATMTGDAVGSSFAGFDVLDGTNSDGSGDLDDLVDLGTSTYYQITSGDVTAGHPGPVGSFGIEFDGTEDFLADFNHTEDEAFNTIGSGISQGLQVWVKPDSASLTSVAGQAIVFDTAGPGGPAISPDGMWTQSGFGHPDLEGTVPVAGDTWSHLAQHIFLHSDVAAPNLVPDTGSALQVTSVIYVDGVAVSAINDNTISLPSPFQVGAAELSGSPVAFYDGVMDELEVYSSTSNSFDLFTDNNYIAEIVAAIPGGLVSGDITMDGDVDQDDVDAIVAGWQMTKSFEGPHNDVYVGDLQTYGWGDLNLDGMVNLADAFILHEALIPAGGLNFGLLLGATSNIPEPSTITLFSLAGLGLVMARRRR